MTLIITHFSKHGIIHASDSNLTRKNDNQTYEGQKTFELPHLNAGMTVAGIYSVGNQPMKQWLDAYIQSDAGSNNASLSSFSYSIRNKLENEMSPEEKKAGIIMHIAGYVEINGMSHPEFYSVRNIHGIDSTTGKYKPPRKDFKCVEEFWSFDGPRNDMMTQFEKGAYQIYINGFPEGRIIYLTVQNMLSQFFEKVWKQPNWKFRPPNSLEEAKLFVETYMSIINNLFNVSDYSAPFIGGPPQVYGIPRPNNTVADF